MRTYPVNLRHVQLPRQQRGVVLLLTLIVLVAMMLAGIGMLRSIDTTTMIAGNMSFKQTAIHAGDVGLNTAYQWLLNVENTNPATLVGNLTDANGNKIYYAFPINDCEVDAKGCTATQLAVFQQWWNPSVAGTDNWIGAPSVAVNDANGKLVATVFYLIHRMCNTTGNCQSFKQSAAASGNSFRSGEFQFQTSAYFYRITAKSVGPRNTVAYSQALVIGP